MVPPVSDGITSCVAHTFGKSAAACAWSKQSDALFAKTQQLHIRVICSTVHGPCRVIGVGKLSKALSKYYTACCPPHTPPPYLHVSRAPALPFWFLRPRPLPPSCLSPLALPHVFTDCQANGRPCLAVCRSSREASRSCFGIGSTAR